jgi:hypothetical protein
MGRANLFAMVADGERIQCAGVFRQTEFFINKEGFTTNLFVLPLGCYDIVLGTRWLATLGPILWDFSKLIMSFWHQDHQVVWRGSSTGSDALLHACTSENLLVYWLSLLMFSLNHKDFLHSVQGIIASTCYLELHRWRYDLIDIRHSKRMN